jgi:hypothetical protein
MISGDAAPIYRNRHRRLPNSIKYNQPQPLASTRSRQFYVRRAGIGYVEVMPSDTPTELRRLVG